MSEMVTASELRRLRDVCRIARGGLVAQLPLSAERTFGTVMDSLVAKGLITCHQSDETPIRYFAPTDKGRVLERMMRD